MAFERSKSLFIPTLQKLCLTEYMKFLESSCAAYIQLSLMDNPLFAKITANMLPVLKQHMEDNMSGTSSSSIREEMLEILFSGKFPSPLYRKSYVEDLRNVPDDPGSHEDRARHQEIKEHGKGCCSPCCTGAFIVETMACIIINDEVRELRFDFSAEHRIWDKTKAIRKYVNFDIPSIMSHLYSSIKKHKEERKPQLARLIISGTGLQTRQFASSYDNTNFILNSYNETKQYVTYPTLLSSSAVDGYSYPTNPYSEDLFLTICDVFSFGLDSFDKLTEIQFGIELSTRSTNVQDRYGQPVSVKLFASIGLCCPNLKILDVSNAVSLPTECFIHLFYHDTYLCLHKYVYLPPFEVDSYHCVVHRQFPETEDIHLHSSDAYCPWCFDPWACNGVRAGCEFLPIPIPVVDDRLYKIIQERYQEDAPKYLAHVIKASDLVRSVEDPMLELVRPPGPSPFEEGFNDTKYRRVKDGGWEYSWYELGDDEPVNYKEFGASHCMKMNHLCETLQVLKLGHLGPRYEIVPFLLTALPQIKTLGAISVLNGLKMIRDIPELGKMELTGLEDITIDIVNRESGHNKLTATLWASSDIKSDVEHFFENLDTPITSVADKRKNLAEDIKLITKYCPKLRSISLFLFLEEFPGLLRPTETWIWQSLESLHHLENMTIICHEWEEVSALFKVVGQKLGRLCLSLDGRGRAFENGGQTAQNRVPALDTLMHSCPDLHTLKIDLRMSTLALSANPSDGLNLNKLKKLSVGLYLTKNAFEWLWTNASNIEELLVPTICNSDTIDLFSGNNYVYYTKDMLAALFKKNTMKHIRKWNVHMCLADIASAFYLVESLRHFGNPEEISKLTIRVQLPQNNYGSQEELLNDVANLMQQMRRFKLDCESKSDPAMEGEKITKIKWTWEKVGLFQSFAEIEQLNAMVEPQNIV